MSIRLYHQLFFLGLLGVLCFAVGVFVPVWQVPVPPPSTLTHADAARIQQEMSLDEVVAILGKPRSLWEGQYHLEAGRELFKIDPLVDLEPRRAVETWVGADCAVQVYFERDKVLQVVISDVRPGRQSTVDYVTGVSRFKE
jgi:hypothetical protein